ncbi:MAG: DegT/DnrJ/EryC1/StrS family aminotransferase [Elusimicrobiota bacterium]
MKIPYINLKAQHKKLKREILAAVSKTLERADFILGKEVSLFEQRAAHYCDTKYAVGVNSGTDALFLAMKSLGLKDDDEVITVPNSFLSTTSSIITAGLKPVFVDVREDMNIDPDLISEKITRKTKAILLVHLTGKTADMHPIMETAKKYNLYIIEDAAQSLGAEYRGKRVGSFGTFGCFSLHPLKTLNACGDGGFITTGDKKLYQKLIRLRNIGLKNRNESPQWGYNSRLDTMQAAILNVKFKYLDRWIEGRRKVAKYYIKNLSDMNGFVKTPEENSHEKCVYHTFIIRAEKRGRLQTYLAKNGIETKIHYPLPIHMQRAAKPLGYKKGAFPVTERLAGEILSLPVYPELTEKQLDYIVDKIRKFYLDFSG